MNYYIASSFANKQKVQQLSAELNKDGHFFTYDWTTNLRADTFEKLQHIGLSERNAVQKADLFIILLPAGKGSHVELGIALAENNPVILHSPEKEAQDFLKTTTFYHLPNVQIITGSDQELLEAITKHINIRTLNA